MDKTQAQTSATDGGDEQADFPLIPSSQIVQTKGLVRDVTHLPQREWTISRIESAIGSIA